MLCHDFNIRYKPLRNTQCHFSKKFPLIYHDKVLSLVFAVSETAFECCR